MNTNQYLITFFEEKKIEFRTFKITDNQNNVHFIDTDFIIESILATGAEEQKQIANVIRKIDFKNGSIIHFFKYLAHGLVKQYEIAA